MEGNQMRMREALEDMYNMLEKLKLYTSHINDVSVMRAFRGRICRAKKIVDAALSEPARNCDVGTAEEQAERMSLYCNSHGVDESGCFRCDKCPFLTVERCELAWAQMPYDVYEKGKCDEQK